MKENETWKQLIHLQKQFVLAGKSLLYLFFFFLNLQLNQRLKNTKEELMKDVAGCLV